MRYKKLTREEMWAKQHINSSDVDYDLWNREREMLQAISHRSPGCFFTVDVFKGRYDFASQSFADIFGYSPLLLEKISEQGDMLEDRIHPVDREQLNEMQIRHSQFIYSLPVEQRNDYSTLYQFRMLNRKHEYVNVVSRQQVFRQDQQGKAWMILGRMDIAPDQHLRDKVECSVLHLKTGAIFNPAVYSPNKLQLTKREIEILQLIRQGLLSKEIAHRLKLSIYTVNNHRKNILVKLNADNAIEALNQAERLRLFDSIQASIPDSSQ